MDDVPYDFIERVFAKLSYPTIGEMDVTAPLWQEVARVHNEKLHRYRCAIRWSAKGLFSGFIREQEFEETMTLEEFAKLDWRHHKVVELSISEHVHGEDLEPIGDRLADVVKFISQFKLEVINVSKLGQWTDPELGFLDECCEHDWQTEILDIETPPGTDAFVLKMLKSDRLETVNLYVLDCFGLSWDLRHQLEAFVCRPNFSELYSDEFQCFDHEGIERIFAYWRSMEDPWTEARIAFGGPREFRIGICEKLTWMERKPNLWPEILVEYYGDFKAVVVNDCDRLTLSFSIAVTKL